jgi:hypothetical protein
MKAMVIQIVLALFGVYFSIVHEYALSAPCVAAAFTVWALRRGES